MITVNPLLVGTAAPPIPAAAGWAAAYDGAHGPLLDLAQAVPGSPPPQALLDRLGAAAADPTSSRYGPILGEPLLRQALAQEVSSLYGATIDPGEIAITAGCNQAFYVAMLALAQAGDAVILPTPWYFNHKMTLDMLGIAAVPLPCRSAHGFVPTVEDARALIGPKTRAIVLVTPNNPTGAVYPAATLEAFNGLAQDHGIALILDETYRDFLPTPGQRPHDLLADPRWRDTVIQLYSFSKSHAVPGHRIGAMTAATGVLDEVAKIMDCLMICSPRAAQTAMAWSIEGTRGWRDEIRALLACRAGLFRAAIAASPGWTIEAIGAYFAYLRHPFDATGDEAAGRLAREAGVVTLPGSFFGPSQDPFLRFAFANVDDDTLGLLAARLALLR